MRDSTTTPCVLFPEAHFEAVLDRHARRRKVRHITVDLDLTDDATHGAQQLSFFNGYAAQGESTPRLTRGARANSPA